MERFQALFGQHRSQIKKYCILTPVLTKGLLKLFGVKALKQGRPYTSGNAAHFTLIHTRIGAPFLGDAVLYLNNTPCENLILLGSCGLVKEKPGLDIGSLVVPTKSYALESFSAMLMNIRKDFPVTHPHPFLLNRFMENDKKRAFTAATCAALGSIKLEAGYKDFFDRKGIDIVDMESSAFFKAAEAIKRKAIAVFYITDIIGKNSPYGPFSSSHQQKIDAALAQATGILKAFTKIKL